MSDNYERYLCAQLENDRLRQELDEAMESAANWKLAASRQGAEADAQRHAANQLQQWREQELRQFLSEKAARKRAEAKVAELEARLRNLEDPLAELAKQAQDLDMGY